MKIATLVLNCVAAVFSIFAMIGTYLYCSFGQTVFFLTKSKDPVFKIGELVSLGGMFLCCVSLALGLVSFFCLLKNKKAFYLIAQLLLFPYNAALFIGGLVMYNYFMVGQYFWTGTIYFPLTIIGILLVIVNFIFAIISFATHKPRRVKART